MLSIVAPFVQAGFALHWLHERRKNPIGKDWQSAPVPTLDDLTRSYAPGNNLGVRLGEPSCVAGYFLHVIDIDIRHDDLADEAWDALARLLPGIELSTLPCVQSGSGGESRHLYFVTDKPYFGRKIAVSDGKSRRHDTARNKDVWSYDWEIELFGTGKQVVLPPSIHPDTGAEYEWVRPFDFDLLDLGIAPHIAAAVIESLGVAETTTYEFETRDPLTFKPEQLEAELDLISVARIDDYHDWVMLGQALHHQFGGSTEGFDLWFKHSAKSPKFDNDRRAMLRKYRGFGKNRRKPVTMASIREWAREARVADLRNAFDEEDDDDTPTEPRAQALGDSSASQDFDDLFGGDGDSGDDDDPFPDEPPARKKLDWVSLLDVNDEGAIKPTLHNTELIVKNDPRLAGLPCLNQFTLEVVQRTSPGTKPGHRKNPAKATRQLSGAIWEVNDKSNGDLWSAAKDNSIRSVLEAPKTQGGYSIKISDRDLTAATELAAWENCFHPVKEFLEGQTWDGTPRVETLFVDYLGAQPTAYSLEVARLMMIAAVCRIYEPGHKFDYAVILEGMQGRRKSTFISTLALDWFAELDGDFADGKEMVEKMQGAWIMEMPELTGFNRSDVRAIKAFISRQQDKVRLAYAKRAQQFPRQCIFIGSTNDDQYLKDDTGGRRFWPMPCDVDSIDIDRLVENRKQLWAEALVLYRQMRAEKPCGTLPLYLRDVDAMAEASMYQESRRLETAEDAISGKIREWLDTPIHTGGFDDAGKTETRNVTCLMQIWVEALEGDPRSYSTLKTAELNRSMSRLREWQKAGTREFPGYGRQKAYSRRGSGA